MKADTHPTYYPKANVTCACGNVFTLGSTKEDIHVEICSSCHPFYTGTEKMLDTAGRAEKFKSRIAAKKTDLKKKTTVKAEKRAKRASTGPKIGK